MVYTTIFNNDKIVCCLSPRIYVYEPQAQYSGKALNWFASQLSDLKTYGAICFLKDSLVICKLYFLLNFGKGIVSCITGRHTKIVGQD